ncbi:uncharacterized protein PAC_19719 [Phialocephala subalpina]|uniref:Uncharacterized protein n=1 Tax=Phialocephala subalpina TaxID=576137 RepID=A0A1L7XXU4_9HELO|nr:uncharacterized protein PAC_19719 [Phialocephala subalpina]
MGGCLPQRRNGTGLHRPVLALTVCGLYGVDLHKANKEHKDNDGKWVYAEVTASLSTFFTVLYLIPFAFIADTILFILSIALFWLFSNMYIKERAEGGSGVQSGLGGFG